jgi:hypothetical protein
MTQEQPLPPRAVCIGHSHSACVAEAVRVAAAPVDVLNFWDLPGAIEDDGDGVTLAPHVLARLRAPVFSLVGGAVHHDVGLLMHRQPYDFIDPAEPDAPCVPDPTYVPYDAVMAGLRRRTQPYLRIMDAVRAAVDGPMFHMQSPPIFAHEAPQEHDPGWVAYHGAGRRIAPAPFRRKLWRMHSAIVEAHCAAAGIAWVACPKAACDEAGYLRQGLNGKPAHANAQYGALVLQQIITLY